MALSALRVAVRQRLDQRSSYLFTIQSKSNSSGFVAQRKFLWKFLWYFPLSQTDFFPDLTSISYAMEARTQLLIPGTVYFVKTNKKQRIISTSLKIVWHVCRYGFGELSSKVICRISGISQLLSSLLEYGEYNSLALILVALV